MLFIWQARIILWNENNYVISRSLCPSVVCHCQSRHGKRLPWQSYLSITILILFKDELLSSTSHFFIAQKFYFCFLVFTLLDRKWQGNYIGEITISLIKALILSQDELLVQGYKFPYLIAHKLNSLLTDKYWSQFDCRCYVLNSRFMKSPLKAWSVSRGALCG